VKTNITQRQQNKVIAVIDMGSNSFHMVVAQSHEGQIKIIDRHKEMVRLSTGLNKSRQLDQQAIERAIACLGRFGQRLRDMNAGSVRVIATNALRAAKKTRLFLKQAQQALGYPVEIISGIEEARLIYKGTVFSISRPEEKRIVVDIGGGSTEVIVGEGNQPVHMESCFMGCVSYSERYFKDGKINAEAFEAAVLDAKQQLRSTANKFKRIGWDIALGASGTIKAIMIIKEQHSDTSQPLGLHHLIDIRDELINIGDIKHLEYANIKKERMPVLPGGLAILIAIFESLEVKQMDFSDGALREGVLSDLIGRLDSDQQDVRVNTVAALERRYSIEQDQADRVEHDAYSLFDMVKHDWQLNDSEHKKYLRWASRLHEIGLDISHASHHRHGAYLLQYMDMPGFAKNEQTMLACLIGCHRRKIRNVFFDDLDEANVIIIKRLLIILRIAVLLNRDRNTSDFPVHKVCVNKESIQLIFVEKYLDQSPLSQLDLEQENNYVKVIDFSIKFS